MWMDAPFGFSHRRYGPGRAFRELRLLLQEPFALCEPSGRRRSALLLLGLEALVKCSFPEDDWNLMLFGLFPVFGRQLNEL